MLKKLIELLGGRSAVAAPSTKQPASPSASGAQLEEQPKLVGKTISFLVAASDDVNTIEYAESDGRVGSNNSDLK